VIGCGPVAIDVERKRNGDIVPVARRAIDSEPGLNQAAAIAVYIHAKGRRFRAVGEVVAKRGFIGRFRRL